MTFKKKWYCCITTILLFFTLAFVNSKVYAVDTVTSTKLNKFSLNSGSTAVTQCNVGTSYTMTANASSTNGVLYQFWVRNLNSDSWAIVQDYSTQSTVNWTPKTSGKYNLVVHVKDKNSKLAYDSYQNVVISASSSSPTGSAKAVLNSFTLNQGNTPVTQCNVGTSYTMTANASSTNGVLYQFWVGDLNSGSWKIIQDYSAQSTVNWTPQNAGKYSLVVHIKDKNSSLPYDSYNSLLVEASGNNAVLNNFKINSASQYNPGVSYTLTADAVSSNGVLYQFYAYDPNNNSWTIIQDYSTQNTVNWTPKTSGKYNLVVHVKDKNSNLSYDSYKNVVVNVEPYTAVLNGLNINQASQYNPSVTYTITSSGTSTNGVLYQFWIGDSAGKWTMIQDYSTQNTVSWTPQYVSMYTVVVHAKDKNSTYSYDTYKSFSVNVEPYKASIESLGITQGGNAVSQYSSGTTYTLTANGTSKNGILYQFWIGYIYTDNWTMIQDYSTKNTVNWTPQYGGVFKVIVHVKDKNGTASYDTYKSILANVSGKTLGRQQSSLQQNLVNYLLDGKANRDSVMAAAIQLHGGVTNNNCAYFASEALRRAGVTSLPKSVCNTHQLTDKLLSYGWVKCTDYTKLLPGDLCFTRNDGSGYPTHVYTFASWANLDNNWLANIVDNQQDKSTGDNYHTRIIDYNDTDDYDAFQYFMYLPH